jgi:hypothetical protein
VKPLIAKKNVSARAQNLHISIEEEARLRMTVIVLVQKQMSIGSEVEQSLNGLKVLDFSVVELVA